MSNVTTQCDTEPGATEKSSDRGAEKNWKCTTRAGLRRRRK